MTMSMNARTVQSTIVSPPIRRPFWVRTTEIPDPGDLTALLPSASSALAWVRGREGMVGWGRLAVVQTLGQDRFAAAQAAWGQLLAGAKIVDEVGLPGTGAVAFTSFTFDASADRSVLIVPRFVVGRRGGRSWITELGTEATAPAPPPIPRGAVGGHPAQLGPGKFEPLGELGRPRWGAGTISADAYRSAVAAASGRMREGRLAKVVLARDLLAQFDSPVDVRRVLAGLTSRYNQCWTYAVDGLVGVAPEMLLAKRGKVLESRVLSRITSPAVDATRVRGEHRFAVKSLRATMNRFCTTMSVMTEESQQNSLPPGGCTQHLTTDIRGVLDDRAAPSILRLVAQIHPTEAVGGRPARLAAATTAKIEGSLGLSRGRYAGPIGWIDAFGDGEFGIALQCAHLSARSARLFAGCRVMAGSDPETELAESTVKFHALAEILGA